jgi:phosphate-selective porin OprO and OprP
MNKSAGLLLSLVWLSSFQPLVVGQETPADRGWFTFTRQAKRPSVRLGNEFRADFRLSFQTDWRGFRPPGASEENLFDLHRSRVGVEGDFLKYFDYEVDYELGDTTLPWRDAYVNFRPSRWFQIQGGKFKIPLSLNQLQGPTRLDFVYRSRIGARLAPARDIGGQIHGRLLRGRRLNYEFGVFRNDGETAYINDDTERTGGVTYAARITGTPLRLLPVPKVFDDLEIGGAWVTTNVEAGAKGLRGRTIGGETIFPTSGSRMFVNGERRRLGAEAMWTPGPLSVKAEFIEAREERKGQSLRAEDLSDLLSRGWYVSGTWLMTGHKYTRRDEPANYLPLHGIGAVELATRYEQIRFGSAGHVGPPSRSTRSPNVLAQSDRVLTLGLNWYMNRWTKTQANLIRETLEDVQRSPVPNQSRLWTWVVRVQYTL